MRMIALATCLVACTTAATAAESVTEAPPALEGATKATPATESVKKATPAAESVKKATPESVKKTTKPLVTRKVVKVPSVEKFTCRTGPNDEQVRLIVEAVKGRAMEFAFYSRLGTRVCSIHGRRGDGQTRWEDAQGASGKAVIKLFTGSAVLEYEPGHVKIQFSDVNRMHYCGMYGELNGSIEAVMKKPECSMQGLFEGSNLPEEKVPTGPAPGD